ncbi:FeoA domain-containing protein [Campylobacter felis]|uniref:FeoA family protein n=1 Tax=Campylobacter felis TaxID=2974565 RepID=UPI0025606378|nr:FeoA family protein [Campylobacter felis]MDL0109407.1 FeoA domain-containing protein [Campylobacter felis]
MTLDSLKNGESALIIGFDAPLELKNRLLSFGFSKNKKLKKLNSSLKKATILVELENSCVILRANEAKFIKVERIPNEKN